MVLQVDNPSTSAEQKPSLSFDPGHGLCLSFVHFVFHREDCINLWEAHYPRVVNKGHVGRMFLFFFFEQLGRMFQAVQSRAYLNARTNNCQHRSGEFTVGGLHLTTAETITIFITVS